MKAGLFRSAGVVSAATLLSRIAGMLCVVTEVTDRVIGERRLRVLRDLAARTMGVEPVEESCGRLRGLKLVYVGDGRNNVANSLMLGCAKAGVNYVNCTPKELPPDPTVN